MNDTRGFLTLNEYQGLAGATNKGTKIYVKRSEYHPSDDVSSFVEVPGGYNAYGLAGEAGEYLEKVKKFARDGTFDRVASAKELGDVLWYISQNARDLGYTLEEIAQMNLAKLKGRKERGVLKGSGDNR